MLGLLLLATYIGYDNPTVTKDLYESEATDDDSAMIEKYRFSTAGGLLCQLCLFALLALIACLTPLTILDFFKPTTTAHWFFYTWAVNWPLTLGSAWVSWRALRQPNTLK